jgi:hypothetical protein
MSSGGYLDQEAQRVRSDLDNVFADFDKVRGTLRLKKSPMPADFPEPALEDASSNTDLSSFDDIMTLTQNLDEELSAWDSIVGNDAPPLMIGSYLPTDVSNQQFASQPAKPVAADPQSSRTRFQRRKIVIFARFCASLRIFSLPDCIFG